jgi:DNA-binding NtrC family response regulator
MSGVAGQISLLIVTAVGSRTVALPERGETILGRGREADVRIDDVLLSRRHIAIVSGDPLTLRDLGSMNGTLLGGRKLAPNESTPLAPGDTITIGTAVLTLQSAATTGRPRRIWPHGYFEARLEEECARSDRTGAPFAILRVRILGGTTTEELPSILLGCLRASDIVGEYAPRELEVLLVDTEAAESEIVARTVEQAFNRRGVAVYVGTAVFRRDGRAPEALVAAAAYPGRAGKDAAEAGTEPLRLGALQRLEPLIERIAAGVISVLIAGETGVGKEVLARTIHERSGRGRARLVAINCAALPETLLESELFGHEKGAFTGATQPRAGLVETAEGGTLFLDEVGEMPLALQAKLLRVLDQREVTRLGSSTARPIDVRFIAATNRDLAGEIKAGRFRQDLYFRLNGITINIPPLRERVEEIEPLARSFITIAARQVQRATPPRLSRESLALLQRYTWPGNIRELRNVMERAVLLCSGDTIGPDHLPEERITRLVSTRPSAPPEPRAAASVIPEALDSRAAPRAVNDVSATRATPERTRIVLALEQCGGNQTHAARILGMARGTLIARMEQFEIRRPRKR